MDTIIAHSANKELVELETYNKIAKIENINININEPMLTIKDLLKSINYEFN